MRTFDGYQHGINLGGWLSQCDHTQERYDNFIVKADIEKISGWGMDHVRIPVDYNLVEEKDGTYIEAGFERLQKAIDWCGEYGLNMILDLHKTYGFSFDSGEKEDGFFEDEEFQERFYRLWEQFATRFGKYSDRLVFELLNEVTEKEYSDAWNRISVNCVKRIRAIAPDIRIIIGGYFNNSIMALKDIAPPVDDKIVYTFHCYEPLIFTHQGAYWVEGMDTEFRMPLDVSYGTYMKYSQLQIDMYKGFEIMTLQGLDPEEKMGVKFFERLVAEAVQVAEERNVPLYCGEYGVIDRANPEDSLKWYQMFTSCMDRYNIARAAWSYKEMDYGIQDEHMDSVREELLKIL